MLLFIVVVGIGIVVVIVIILTSLSLSIFLSYHQINGRGCHARSGPREGMDRTASPATWIGRQNRWFAFSPVAMLESGGTIGESHGDEESIE